MNAVVVAGSGWAAGTAAWLRPAFGGGIPAGTPVAPPTPVVPPSPPVAGDITVFVLLICAAFAFFGFVSLRGVRRETITLTVVAAAFVGLSQGWGTVVKWANKLYKLFYFAVIKGGIAADDPTTAWKEVKDMAGLLPTDGDAAHAQMAAFMICLIAAYTLTLLVLWPKGGAEYKFKAPTVLDRLIAAVVSTVTGYLVASFLLTRALPGATIDVVAPDAPALALPKLALPGLLGTFVIALILYGYRSLGARKYKKTYT